MEQTKILEILKRNELKEEIKKCILSFNKDENIKKNIYIYGDCCSGKTTFIKNIIEEINYDMILCDNMDSRNKNYIENISNGNISNQNVLNLFNKVKKNIIIVMDDIDTINDKNFLMSLIKLIRPKKTKKQKLEGSSFIQIICIGNTIEDKKLKELANGCITFKLDTPTLQQMNELIQYLMPDIDIKIDNINLKKLEILYKVYLKDKTINSVTGNYLNTEVKECTKNIINQKYSNINETDRNIIGLLLHENIIDVIEPKDQNRYIQFMKNICFSDYIDKFIFQKQIWQLNEVNFNIKVLKNMYLLKNTKMIKEIRFTKILTKYSTEYNNYMFIRELCISLSLEVKDMYQYFLQLKDTPIEIIVNILEQYDITQLEINRIYKFLDKLKNGEEE